MKTKSRKSGLGLLIIAFVMLFNPNITVVDLLPDFIAWFILAHLFERAADSAAHFEEARVGFMRLGAVSLLRIPVFVLIMFIKGKNPMDNDVFALASFTFAAVEGVLGFTTAKNTFLALFHLGERSDATSLIEPFKSPITKRKITTDSYRDYTYFFFICKPLLYALPDFFLLTRITDSGMPTAFSPNYPPAILISQILGLILGTVWLIRSIGYAKAIIGEKRFNDALTAVAREGSSDAYERKVRIRKVGAALTAFAIASVFTVVLTFDDFKNIDILPTFIFGIIATTSIYKLREYVPKFKGAFVSGICYSAVALADYISLAVFLSKYDYSALINDQAARNKYFTVQIFGALHLIMLIVFTVFTALFFRSFIKNHTGLSPESERYGKMEREYHNSLTTRLYVLLGIGLLGGAARCVSVFLNSDISLIFADVNDVTSPIISVSPLPWFDVVVTVISLIYVGYSLYYFSMLKDEVKMKYV